MPAIRSDPPGLNLTREALAMLGLESAMPPGAYGESDQKLALNPATSGNGKPIDQGGHFYSLLAYGAVGNGVANDNAAWLAAYAACPVGGTVFCPSGYNYLTTAAWTISKSLSVQIEGTVTQSSGATAGFVVNASSVRLYGSGSIVGAQFANTVDTERAIEITGPSMASALTDVTVDTLALNTWGGWGVRAKYAKNVRCVRTTIRNIRYCALGFLSVQAFTCSLNYINNVTAPVQSYGIADGRDGNIDSLVTDPQCNDGIYVGNVIVSVTNWEGLDTHAGLRHTITANVVENCYVGINSSAAKNGSGVEQYASQQCNIVANSCDSLKTDGSALYGIAYAGPAGNGVGARTYAPATGCIASNTLKGYGDQSNDHSGAIYLRDTQGIVVNGNAITAPSPHGICLYYNNWSFSVTANSIIDPFSNTGGVGHATGIGLISQYNSGWIDGNFSDTTGSVAATYLLTEGIHVNNDANSTVKLGSNGTTAAVQLYDPGARSTSTSGAGTLITGSGTWTVPLSGTYRIIAVGSGGGGGGGGSALTSGGVATQVGGSGGAAAMTAELVVAIAAGVVLTVTIGAVGTGGNGGALNSNPGINGVSGGNTTVSGTGVALTATGGGLGAGGAANSTATVNGALWGAPGNTTSLAGVSNGGTATSATGTRGGASQGLAGGGGSGGAPASASFGGNGGNGGPANGQNASIATLTGTTTGGVGGTGLGYGAGGAGGGGGAPGGAGGNGGPGSIGVVSVMKIA